MSHEYQDAEIVRLCALSLSFLSGSKSPSSSASHSVQSAFCFTFATSRVDSAAYTVDVGHPMPLVPIPPSESHFSSSGQGRSVALLWRMKLNEVQLANPYIQLPHLSQVSWRTVGCR